MQDEECRLLRIENDEVAAEVSNLQWTLSKYVNAARVVSLSLCAALERSIVVRVSRCERAILGRCEIEWRHDGELVDEPESPV